MSNESIAKEDLIKTEENLARMIQKGFDENTKEHQHIFNRLETIETKLEDLVYRNEFEKLETRVKVLEEALNIKC